MSEQGAEACILAVNALGTGLLLFVAGVVQKVMNGMPELEFKRFLTELDRTAEKNVYAVAVATLPIVAAIPYFCFDGFTHWWFTAGVAVWLLASVTSKLLNLPIYRWIEDPANVDPQRIAERRRELQRANNLRSWLSLASVALMTAQFV